MLLIWKDTLNRKIQITVWVSTVHRDQDQTEAKTRGGHTEPPPTSCFILTRTKTHQWPGHNHLEHIKHRPCRDRRIMLNHPGKINITAPIKSNADLRLALSISIDPATSTMSNTHSTAALDIAAAATENSCCQHQSGKTITAANGHNPWNVHVKGDN